MRRVPALAARRLASQQLEHPGLRRPEQLVHGLVAMQGQDYAGAKWSVGLRLPGSTDADVERALAAKRIVRTWALRGTLHLVAAEDLRWLLALVGPRVIAANARRYRQLELDESTLARGCEVLALALEGGRELSRAQLFSLLEQNSLSTRGQRGVYLLQRASLDGIIAQCGVRRNNSIFFLLAPAPARAPRFARDEAAAHLARLYFTSRGPATLQDFVWWSGMPTAEARAALAAVESELARETAAGQIYWSSATRRRGLHDPRRAYLLPGFDEYLLAYRDRSASLDRPHARLASANGMFHPTLVLDGRVIGTWKRVIQSNQVTVAPSPFAPLSEAQRRALATAARRYARFLGLPVKLL